jgi:hypothetical protein
MALGSQASRESLGGNDCPKRAIACCALRELRGPKSARAYPALGACNSLRDGHQHQ